jgi:hypothetical protein
MLHHTARAKATDLSKRLTAALLVACGILAVSAPTGAVAATGSAAWSVRSLAYPSDFSPEDNSPCTVELALSSAGARFACDTYMTVAANVGSRETATSTATLTDAVPTGLAIQNVELFFEQGSDPPLDITSFGEEHKPSCSVTGSLVECVAHIGHAVMPDAAVRMYVSVTVPPSTPQATLKNPVSVSSVGLAKVKVEGLNTVKAGPPPFGPELFEANFRDVTGKESVAAGGHPYELDTVIPLGSETREAPQSTIVATTVEDPRDVIIDLPVGMSGSGVSAPQCTLARLSSKGPTKVQGASGCPVNTIIGHVFTTPEGLAAADFPIYNLVPEHGYAAELGFIDATGSSHVLYVTLVPTDKGYVLRTTSKEIPEFALVEILANVYGNPTQRDHELEELAKTKKLGSLVSPGPYTFTNPSDCSGEPLTTTVLMDSWQHPGSYNPDGTPDLSDPNWVSKTSESAAVTGCEALAGLFEPAVTAASSSSQGDSPTGLEVDLSVPQNTGPEGQSTPPLRDTVVALPEGLVVNPASANGLGACSEAQVGISPSSVPNAAAPECPDSSKVGTVELETPALPGEVCRSPQTALEQCPEPGEREHVHLTGSIYVAKQLENPFGSLLALYIVIDDPRTGVVVKLPAEIKTNPVTGRLTTDVRDTPQFPFSELRTHFFAGNTAALRTPATCGSYTVSTELTPWSAPESGPPATPSSAFEVTQGAGGGACPQSAGEEPNSPSFEAGTTTPTAGAYSPLTVHLTRVDGSQNFSALNVTLPPGATGKLAGIPQCTEAQIATAQARSNPGEGAVELAGPSCPVSSQIGTVTVGAGAGPSPFYVTGRAYLAGPYKGAPFSMAIVTPAVAGPFDFGVVVVRAGLYIDPSTAQVTAKSDPIPSILQGIPLDVRSVTVNVDRPGFTLNPTSCAPMAVTGEEISTQGQVARLSGRFQVGSCQSLAFKPDLTASTTGKASKANGATLDVKVAYPSAPFTGYANIKSVKVSLPKQLPSRLTTLQKACLASVFEANPASCPAASDVGTATASTPLLSSRLSGPAYIVSHGNEAFPDLEIVLQGENITLVLDGNTQIKNGITSSTFKAVPDAPVSSFELKLPTGKFSILGANVPQSARYSLCGQSLKMPTEITAQNGALINQTTKIAITGCAKPKTLTRAEKLKKALKACHKEKKRSKRAACERQARKRYAPVKAKRGKKK